MIVFISIPVKACKVRAIPKKIDPIRASWVKMKQTMAYVLAQGPNLMLKMRISTYLSIAPIKRNEIPGGKKMLPVA